MNVKLLNQMLDEYLLDACLDDFEFIKKLNDIVLKNTKFYKEVKYKEKIDLNYSASLVYTFFKSISEEYALYFEKRLNDGTFQFSDKFNVGESYFDKKQNKNVIKIPITGSIEDSYVMVHELLHDMNYQGGDLLLCRVLTTESISILGELLFYDFLLKYNLKPKENRKTIINDFYSIRKMSLLTDLELKIVDEYFKCGYVNSSFLNRLSLNYDDDVVEHLNLNNSDTLEIDYNQRYMIGALLSCYMYDRIKENPKFIKELFEINSIMNHTYFECIIDYLDLSIKQNDEYVFFTDSSLQKLEKTYKKVLKEL